MINREQISSNLGVQRSDYRNEPLDIILEEEEVHIAFSWVLNDNLDFDVIANGLGKLIIRTDEFIDGASQGFTESEEIEFCDENSFPFNYSQKVPNRRRDVQFYCFKQSDLLKVKYNATDKEFANVFRVDALPCPDQSCEGVIKDIIERNSVIYLTILSKYFDSTDPLDPVKTLVQDEFMLPISQGEAKAQRFYLQRHKYTVNDWYSLVTGSTEGEFYDIAEGQFGSQNMYNDNTITVFRFDASDTIQIHEITVVGVMEVLGLIGGLFEIMYITTSILLSTITGFILKMDTRKLQLSKFSSEGWFSHPLPSLIPEKQRRVRNFNSKSLSRMKYKEIEEIKKSPNLNQNLNHRSSCYRAKNDDEKAHEDPFIKIEEIRKKISIDKDITKGIDVLDVAQSIKELKLYVGYLLDQEKEKNCHEFSHSEVEDGRHRRLI